jgi:hypothetical protein
LIEKVKAHSMQARFRRAFSQVGRRKTLEGLLSNVLAAQATAAHFLDMSHHQEKDLL